jgi:hypothetical protein
MGMKVEFCCDAAVIDDSDAVVRDPSGLDGLLFDEEIANFLIDHECGDIPVESGVVVLHSVNGQVTIHVIFGARRQLTEDEVARLEHYVSMQMSDGLGEAIDLDGIHVRAISETTRRLS